MFAGSRRSRSIRRFGGTAEPIEAEVGAKLHWANHPEGKSFEVVYRKPVDPASETSGPPTSTGSVGPWSPSAASSGAAYPKPEAGGPARCRRTTHGTQAAPGRILDRPSGAAGRNAFAPETPETAATSRGRTSRSALRLQPGGSTNKAKGRSTVTSCCTDPFANRISAMLESGADAIEGEMGQTLDWRECPDVELSQVRVSGRHGVDPADRSAWPEQHRWFQENGGVGKLNGSFHKRLWSPSGRIQGGSGLPVTTTETMQLRVTRTENLEASSGFSARIKALKGEEVPVRPRADGGESSA